MKSGDLSFPIRAVSFGPALGRAAFRTVILWIVIQSLTSCVGPGRVSSAAAVVSQSPQAEQSQPALQSDLPENSCVLGLPNECNPIPPRPEGFEESACPIPAQPSAEALPKREDLLQNGILVMDNENYLTCIDAVCADLDAYDGTSIEVIGFVFRDFEGIAENEFVAARMVMVCCEDDMEPLGFLCRYENAENFKDGQWARVTGMIRKTQYEGETIPCIEVQEMEAVPPPDQEIIIP
jgi:uncharacterized repeat protein (TIGR03943 family)